MDTKELLLMALKEAKITEKRTRNEKLTQDIRRVIKAHFPDSKTAKVMREAMRATTPSNTVSGGMKDWEPGSGLSKKNENNVGKKDNNPQDVVDDPTDAGNPGEDNDPLEDPVELTDEEKMIEQLKNIRDKNTQELLDLFGDYKALKQFAKDQGFEINQKLKPDNFITALKEQVSELLDD